jgi:hypothetical protein
MFSMRRGKTTLLPTGPFLFTMSRPELTGHASLFYNAKEARKYDSSSRMIGVQREITERAIELLRSIAQGDVCVWNGHPIVAKH